MSHVPGRRGPGSRSTIGWYMTPERRWSQLHRCDERLLEMAAAAEALAVAEADWVRAYPVELEPLPDEPLPHEPEDDPAVLTEVDVRRIALEVLGELLGVSA